MIGSEQSYMSETGSSFWSRMKNEWKNLLQACQAYGKERCGIGC